MRVGVPKNDLFQVIAEYEADSFLFDPDYLGIHRSDVGLLAALEYDLVPKLARPVFKQPIYPCAHIFGFKKCRGDFVD
jgi:hypothetical protein